MNKLTLNCPINQTGYGIASLNLIKALKPETELGYVPIGNPGVSSQEDYNLIQSLLNNQDNIDINAPVMKIWHQFDLAMRFGKGKYFAMPFFELDTFNSREKQHLSVPDTIFVTSEWGRSVVEDNDVTTPVKVIPLGVDTDIFNPNVIDTPINNEKYVFLNIGKWEVRKGHDILYKLFKDAFPTEQDVELWVLASETTNGYSNEEQLKEWKDLYSGDERIRLSSGVATHQDIATIMANVNCGIFPSRAEGWNLEILEMMAMNKPVIATNYSAHTEFCNTDNCYLIDITETELAKDGKAFYGQGNWAKIGQNQYDQTISYMRQAYSNRILSNPKGVETAQAFSWKNSANKILRCINE